MYASSVAPIRMPAISSTTQVQPLRYAFKVSALIYSRKFLQKIFFFLQQYMPPDAQAEKEKRDFELGKKKQLLYALYQLRQFALMLTELVFSVLWNLQISSKPASFEKSTSTVVHQYCSYNNQVSMLTPCACVCREMVVRSVTTKSYLSRVQKCSWSCTGAMCVVAL